MIKFCRLNINLANFLRRYIAWVQFQNLSGKHEPAVAISEAFADDAVRIYDRTEVEFIKADPRPVIGIDLREGLKEAEAINTLPANKHYILFCGSYPGQPVHIKLDHTMIYYESILEDMIDLHLNTKSPFFYTDRCYNFDYPKPLQFVSFNAVERLYRTQLASWLPELPYKNFVYRLNQKDLGQPADHLDVIDFSTVQTDVANWFESQALHIKDPHFHIVGRIPNRMMNQAFFNLVLETDFDFAAGCMTEKSCRPLLMGMPFVIASCAGYLARLRSLGFKTYGDLWDESYDLEPDKDARLRRIFELVRDLGHFDWQKHQTALELIGLHNRAQFLNLGPVLDQEFTRFEQTIKQLERTNPMFNQSVAPT